MDTWSAFVFGVAVGPGVNNFLMYVVPLARRIIDVLADKLCPMRPVKDEKLVPSLAETFDDMDAVTAAVTLETLRHRGRPAWVPEDRSPPAGPPEPIRVPADDTEDHVPDVATAESVEAERPQSPSDQS